MNLLSIGGSDPTSGAGIQSDLRVTANIGVHCLCIITAITGQNTRDFGMIEPVSPKMIKNQLDMVIDDFEIDAVKIGMVYDSEIINTIRHYIPKIAAPVVVDPVIRSTTGGMLISSTAIKDLRGLISDSTIVTPNRSEAEILAEVEFKESPEEIATAIQKIGVQNVIITGIRARDKVVDIIAESDRYHYITGDYISGENHGSGCNYAATLAVGLGSKMTIYDAAVYAKKMTLSGINTAAHLGQGIPITDIQLTDYIMRDITQSISKFVKIDHISEHIPECQTNFVYAKSNPQRLDDIVGVRGRIIKSGRRVIVAGDIIYGGSKHIATAVIAISQRFPNIRSAVNIAYSKSIIERAINKGMIVSKYDRQQEPDDVKVEGSSISWGIKSVTDSVSKPPDIIYHTGDWGKEPMIIIFGTRPDHVLEKLSKLITDS